MSLRALISILVLGTFLFLAAWLWTINQFDPQNGGAWVLVLFFVSLLGFLIGIFSLVFFYIRLRMKGIKKAAHSMPRSLRQATVLSMTAVTLLLLQAFQVLFWWNFLVVVLLALLIESYLLTTERESTD